MSDGELQTDPSHDCIQIFLIVSKLPKNHLEVYFDSFVKLQNDTFCFLMYFTGLNIIINICLIYFTFTLNSQMTVCQSSAKCCFITTLNISN